MSLDLVAFVDQCRSSNLALTGSFMGNDLELLNDKEHLEVLQRVVLFAGVAVSHLEGPLLHV